MDHSFQIKIVALVTFYQIQLQKKNKNKQKKGEQHLIVSKKAAPPASEQNSPRNVRF